MVALHAQVTVSSKHQTSLRQNPWERLSRASQYLVSQLGLHLRNTLHPQVSHKYGCGVPSQSHSWTGCKSIPSLDFVFAFLCIELCSGGQLLHRMHAYPLRQTISSPDQLPERRQIWPLVAPWLSHTSPSASWAPPATHLWVPRTSHNSHRGTSSAWSYKVSKTTFL